MMTKLRERTAIILWIVIFAFVGLIVVEWGADYSGSGSNPAGDAVGVVNGEKITLKQFQQALRFAAQRQRAGGQASDQDGLVRELWDEFVRDILVSQEIERLGIEVTDKELALVTRTQPPPAVQTMEVFQTEGVFDPVKYNQFLSDPTTYSDPRNKFFVMQVEDIVRQQWLNYRLQGILKETVQVSPAELREYFEDRNELVEVEYLFVPSSSIPDGEVTLSEGDLEAFLQENAEDYRHPDQIRIEFRGPSKNSQRRGFRTRRRGNQNPAQGDPRRRRFRSPGQVGVRGRGLGCKRWRPGGIRTRTHGAGLRAGCFRTGAWTGLRPGDDPLRMAPHQGRGTPGGRGPGTNPGAPTFSSRSVPPA